MEILFNADVSPEVCNKAVWLEPSLLMLMILAAEVLLIMRLWALWDRAIWIIGVFAVLLSAEISISIWCLSEWAQSKSLQRNTLFADLHLFIPLQQSAASLYPSHLNST